MITSQHWAYYKQFKFTFFLIVLKNSNHICIKILYNELLLIEIIFIFFLFFSFRNKNKDLNSIIFSSCYMLYNSLLEFLFQSKT